MINVRVLGSNSEEHVSMLYVDYQFEVRNGSILFDKELDKLLGIAEGTKFVLVNDAGRLVLNPVDLKSDLGDNGGILSKE